MSANELRARRKYLHELSRKYITGVFVEIPKEEWPTERLPLIPTRAMRSREFLVQLFEQDPIVRLSVNRVELAGTGDWKDGITWDELQSIKDACGYGDRDAVEVYPRTCDVVNVANIRHLWILPEASKDFPFIWRQYHE